MILLGKKNLMMKNQFIYGLNDLIFTMKWVQAWIFI